MKGLQVAYSLENRGRPVVIENWLTNWANYSHLDNIVGQQLTNNQWLISQLLPNHWSIIYQMLANCWPIPRPKHHSHEYLRHLLPCGSISIRVKVCGSIFKMFCVKFTHWVNHQKNDHEWSRVGKVAWWVLIPTQLISGGSSIIKSQDEVKMLTTKTICDHPQN